MVRCGTCRGRNIAVAATSKEYRIFPVVKLGIDGRLRLASGFSLVGRAGNYHRWCRINCKCCVAGFWSFTIGSNRKGYCCRSSTMVWRGATGIGEHAITTTGEGGCGFPGSKLTINSRLCLTGCFGDIGRAGNNDRWCRIYRKRGVAGFWSFTIGSNRESDCCGATAMVWRGAT